MKRVAVASAFGAALLCAPMAVHAQDAQPTPTPAPVLTDPRVPSDFSLPSSESRPEVVGPARPADAPARGTVVPQVTPTPTPAATSQPALTRQPQVEPSVRQPASTATNTPAQRSDTPVPQQQETQPQQGAPVPDAAVSTDAPAAGAPVALPTEIAGPEAQSAPGASEAELGEAGSENGFGWIAAALLAALAGIAGFVFLRRRRSTGSAAGAVAPQVERPVLPERVASPQPAPKPAPAPSQPPPAPPRPAPAAANGLVQARQRPATRTDDNGLVTVRSPNAPLRPSDGLVSTRPPAGGAAGGLVTTNLAQKQRERAQAQERTQTPAPSPAPRPAPVKRNISFDWS